MRSRAASPRAILALSIVAMVGRAAAQEAEEPRAPLALCTDDGKDAEDALFAELDEASRFVVIAPGASCEERTAALLPEGDGTRFVGRFETSDEGWTVLSIASAQAPGERRATRIPWLASPSKPIGATVEAGKLHALALLIDGLILDFRYLALSSAEPPPAEAPCPVPVAPPPTPICPAPHPKPAVAFGIEIAAGAVYLSPDAVAPRLELGGAVGSGRWRAVLEVGADLDSNYRIGDRTFTTFAAGIRLGARYLFSLGARGAVGVEMAAAWLGNRYRRDMEGATTRTWSDLGAYLGFFGRARLVGPLGIFLRVGAAIHPTARVTTISGGPEKQANLFTAPATAGLDFDF